MSFRQFGGLNYAAKHNIVSSNYNTSNNLLVTQNVGQPNSYINFLSDISGNISVYGDFDLSGNLIVTGSSSFTGIPTAPTASTGTNNTQIATTAFVHNTIIDASTNTLLSSNNTWYGTNTFNQLVSCNQGLDVSGNLGINTLTPYATLSVGDASSNITSNIVNALAYFSMDRNANYGGLVIGNKNGNFSTINASYLGNGSLSEGMSISAIPGNTNQLYISNNGNVGIGKSPGSYALDVSGNLNIASDNLYISNPSTNYGNIYIGPQNTGLLLQSYQQACYIRNNYNSSGVLYLGVGTNDNTLTLQTGKLGINTNPVYTLDVSGNGHFTGQVSASSFNSTSDYRIKENIQLLNELYTVDNLRPITYLNKRTEKQDIGLLAHELQEHFPCLVNGEKDLENLQTINYTGLIPILIKEIQELKKEIKLLKEKI